MISFPMTYLIELSHPTLYLCRADISYVSLIPENFIRKYVKSKYIYVWNVSFEKHVNWPNQSLTAISFFLTSLQTKFSKSVKIEELMTNY